MQKIVLSQSSGPRALPILYHNADEIVPSRRGLALYRVPRDWRERFPPQAAARAMQAAGVELRFCADTRYLALDLFTENTFGYPPALAVYLGRRNVAWAMLPLKQGRAKAVLLNWQQPIPGAGEETWRIVLPYGATVAVKALYLSDGAELLPVAGRPVRWLAHGDSITQGAHALHPGLTYTHLVADQLGWDALNLGFGGSAWGDAVVAEYIASRQDWDILSIAIGTNTYGAERASADEFAACYDRFLAIIRQAHPTRPILCITPIWRKEEAQQTPNRFGDTLDAYRQAIRRVVAARQPGDPRLQLLDGLELIGSAEGLTADRIHPDAHGMVAMAEGVAVALRRLWNT
jgi:lysophospholipase L1-like esterase